MRIWQLYSGDPMSLVLAADPLVNNIDYANDQIWNISLEGGDPPSVYAETTYGLRVHWMRFFGQFTINGRTLCDPRGFAEKPRVTVFYPNFLSIIYSPIAGLEVLSDYWIPSSQVITGRFQFFNKLDEELQLTFEWFGVLNPLGKGEQMSVMPIEMSYVLQGSAGELSPVCFLTGGPSPGSGSHSGLVLDLEIEPGKARRTSWAAAALCEKQQSFDIARRTVTRDWEANVARLEILNESRTVHFWTGCRDWDAVLAMSQRVGAGLIHDKSSHLPNASFVLNRLPDQGFSIQGNGSDYGYLWNGQSVLDSYFLAGVLLPGSEQYIRGLVDNFLAVQGENGWIDWKPGLDGQRSKQLAQPMLAQLVCDVIANDEDENWLRMIFPGLVKFFLQWFLHEDDPDQAEFPSWKHPVQTGFADSPIYGHVDSASHGVAIKFLRSPALAAMLANEGRCLLRIAEQLGVTSDVSLIREYYDWMLCMIETCWNPEKGMYQYQDIDSEAGGGAIELISIEGGGQFSISRSFKQPHRLQISINIAEEHICTTKIIIYGETTRGDKKEKIKPAQFLWIGQCGYATTRSLFKQVEKIEILNDGLMARVSLTTVDYSPEDLTLFLPLWAKIPDHDRARQMIENHLLPRYVKKNGLVLHPATAQSNEAAATERVTFSWMRFMVEGLLLFGYRSVAADIVSRSLDAAATCLKEHGAFFRYYDANTPGGYGEKNVLAGLFPVQAMLDVMGVRFISHREVVIDGENPFSHPVRVKFRGVVVERRAGETDVIFPGVNPLTVTGPGPHTVFLR